MHDAVVVEDDAFASLEREPHQVTVLLQHPPEAAECRVIVVQHLLRQVHHVQQVLADGQPGDIAVAVQFDDALIAAHVVAIVLAVERHVDF